MTMFPSNPLAADDIDAGMADATPTTAPAPAPAAPKERETQIVEAKRKDPPPPVRYVEGDLIPDDLSGLQRLAMLYVASGTYGALLNGCQSPEACVARLALVIATGRQVGLNPHAATSNMAIVNGRMVMWGDALVAIVRMSGTCRGIQCSWDEKAKAATCVGTRLYPDGSTETCTHTFSIADAERAGYAGKSGPWKTNPPRMCQNRARAFVLRDLWADKLCGIGDYEEQMDIEESNKSARESEAGSKLSALAGT